jgi:hypothetical protein
MVTDIGSLAPVLDGHTLRLGIGPKGSGKKKKNGEAPTVFLGALSFP